MKMSGWAQKRFWKSAETSQAEGGFAVTLDGRRIKTPAKAPLVVPTEALARAIADEWMAQEEVVKPATMPLTRAANAAIDKVAIQKEEVADMLTAYGDADLLCYRAESPQELVTRQEEAWDPALDWAKKEFGVRLQPRAGVMHAAQKPEALEALAREVHLLNAFELAAFHDLVALSGSLVLGFAAARDWKPIDEVWNISRVDDLWQEEQWGRDEEAHAQATYKLGEFRNAKAFWDLCATSSD